MDRLPNEVLLKILSYLDTYELMNFCTAFGNDCFLKDSLLNRSVNFSRRFELRGINLCTYIITNLNFTSIKSLNINYLYWIPAEQLRTLIKQLENLEILYALDTQLALESKDIDGYVKLKKLAVSVHTLDRNAIEACKKLETLNSLCLKILQKEVIYSIYDLFKELQRIEELWISDEDESFLTIDYHFVVNVLSNLKKLFIKSKVPLPYEYFDEHNFFKTFECRRNGRETELVFEKLSSKPEYTGAVSELQNGVDKSLEFLQTSLHDLPCGPVESKQIYLKKRMENVYFVELNFCHPVILCNSKYNDAAIQILSSKNSVKLRRLRVRSCLFQTSQIEEPGKSASMSKRFKEEREEPKTHPFSITAGNLKNLRELEIESCPVCNKRAVLSAYLLLHTFENLRKLTLEIPPLMDGLFLKEVFMRCRNLESLNFTCVVQNQQFITHLCTNLKYAANLRDFRLNNKDVKIDALLESFSDNKKLQRIFIKCDNLQYMRNTSDRKLFHTFIKNNPQLILLVVVSKKQNSHIQEMLDNCKGSKFPKVFCIAGADKWHDRRAHRDIIFNCTNVSAINIDEF